MDYQSLHMKTVADLRLLAKANGVRLPAGTKKAQIIALLLEAEAQASRPAPEKPLVEAAEAGNNPPAAEPRRRGRPPKKPIQAAAESVDRPEVSQETAALEEAAENAPIAQAPQGDKPAQAQPAAPEATPSEPTQPEAREAAAQYEAQNPAPTSEPADRPEPRAQYEAQKPAPASDAAGKPEARARYEAQKPAPASDAADKPEPTPSSAPVNAARPTPDMAQGARYRSNPRPMGNAYAQRNAGMGTPMQRGVGDAAGRAFVRQPGARLPLRNVPSQAQRSPNAPVAPNAQGQEQTREIPETGSARGRREGYYNAEYKTSNPAVPEMLAAGECQDGAGVLEIQQDGYGFLRAENCLPGPNDVYISIAQIRRFNLRMGDYVEGKTRPQREGDRYSAMLYITSVNGKPPEDAANRPRFEDLVPIYPDQRLRLEMPDAANKGDLSLRLIDMLAPIGKGQRGMIVSQPKAGKTTLLKKVANAITARYPEVKLIVMLIDERPEEVTDMKRSIDGEVIYSTFDEAPENHVRVSEMVLERAQRLVEMGQDVVVLMDSITRLARAYNLVITPTGRSLSGGLDPGALFKPKRFFGAARNIENGGSLTVIATALVDTGSRMDDIIFEEFKGTGNMELHLDRKLSDRRVFPAIDMMRSGTRREELLLTEAELDGEMLVRRVLSSGKGQEMFEQIISLMSKTATNAEFFEKMKQWLAVFEKGGYSVPNKPQ